MFNQSFLGPFDWIYRRENVFFVLVFEGFAWITSRNSSIKGGSRSSLSSRLIILQKFLSRTWNVSCCESFALLQHFETMAQVLGNRRSSAWCAAKNLKVKKTKPSYLLLQCCFFSCRDCIPDFVQWPCLKSKTLSFFPGQQESENFCRIYSSSNKTFLGEFCKI